MTRFAVPLLLSISIGILFSGCSTMPNPSIQNQHLGRGINMGNALEAPREGEWGVTLNESYFRLAREAGFESVRIPVRWSEHAETEPPYTIYQEFTERVQWAVDTALAQHLHVVINFHHYTDLMEQPLEESARFLSLWGQVAEQFKDYPDTLMFEVLNEPCQKLTADLWNEMLRDAMNIIRQSNPDRTLIIGTTMWGGMKGLAPLRVPDAEENIIVTFHYYNPFHFTHQGAEWVNNSAPWLGTTWTGSDEEKQDILKDLDHAAAWAKQHDRPLYMGEFGAYSKADMGSRARWTAFVAREAEKRGFSWAYWEFCSGFGVYDAQREAWRPALRKALLP